MNNKSKTVLLDAAMAYTESSMTYKDPFQPKANIFI